MTTKRRRLECGTPAGWRLHQRRGETLCDDCARTHALYGRPRPVTETHALDMHYPRYDLVRALGRVVANRPVLEPASVTAEQILELVADHLLAADPDYAGAVWASRWLRGVLGEDR